jgi:hypothetical protein
VARRSRVVRNSQLGFPILASATSLLLPPQFSTYYVPHARDEGLFFNALLVLVMKHH